jgi:hypothetical protein
VFADVEGKLIVDTSEAKGLGHRTPPRCAGAPAQWVICAGKEI